MIGPSQEEGSMAGLHSNCTTEPDSFRRVEVISGVARRRRWPRSDKARIVAESYAPGASATAVAVRHGLHRNQIFAWRRELRNHMALVGAGAPTFVPVRLASPADLERIVSGRTKANELNSLLPWAWKASQKTDAAVNTCIRSSTIRPLDMSSSSPTFLPRARRRTHRFAAPSEAPSFVDAASSTRS
jgi:transposase-like protein